MKNSATRWRHFARSADGYDLSSLEGIKAVPKVGGSITTQGSALSLVYGAMERFHAVPDVFYAHERGRQIEMVAWHVLQNTLGAVQANKTKRDHDRNFPPVPRKR